jgi:hypothetical protein
MYWPTGASQPSRPTNKPATTGAASRNATRAVVQEQSETIGLLLKDFEEGASDWLWETDGTGRPLGRELAQDRQDVEVLDLQVLAVPAEQAGKAAAAACAGCRASACGTGRWCRSRARPSACC